MTFHTVRPRLNAYSIRHQLLGGQYILLNLLFILSALFQMPTQSDIRSWPDSTILLNLLFILSALPRLQTLLYETQKADSTIAL